MSREQQTIDALAWLQTKEAEYYELLAELSKHFRGKAGYGVSAASGLIEPDLLTGRTHCVFMSKVASHAIRWRYPALPVTIRGGTVPAYNDRNNPTVIRKSHSWFEINHTDAVDMTAKQFHPERKIMLHCNRSALEQLQYEVDWSVQVSRPIHTPGIYHLRSEPTSISSPAQNNVYIRMLDLFEIPKY